MKDLALQESDKIFFSITLKISMMIRKCYYILFSFLILKTCSCQSQSKQDTELTNLENDTTEVTKGNNYTPLGALLAYPWEYEVVTIDPSDSRNLKSGISYEKIKQIRQDLVFEPQKDGSLKYWFKSDYLVSPVDTVILADGSKSITINRLKSKDLKIKKIYSTGKWEANFKDSTIMIDFGENDFGLNAIKGKYVLLNASSFRIMEEINYSDKSTKKPLKKTHGYYFVHYKI
jgi:hypothetical protein